MGKYQFPERDMSWAAPKPTYKKPPPLKINKIGFGPAVMPDHVQHVTVSGKKWVLESVLTKTQQANTKILMKLGYRSGTP